MTRIAAHLPRTLPRLFLTGAAACLALAPAGLAQAPQMQPAPSAQGPTATPQGDGDAAARREAARALRALELKELEDGAKAAADARTKAEAEAAAIQTDRARLNQALIDTGERVRAAENRAAQAEDRLVTLRTTEEAIRGSLSGRQAVIVEVLAALQRLGRRPPPAVLARPEDMLQAVRTAILLGAVLPELKAEAELLASDLAELARLRDAAGRERESVSAELKTLDEERERLAALVAARQQQLQLAERSVAAERERSAQLAARAQSMRDLVEGLDKEIAEANRQMEAARLARDTQSREARERFAAAAALGPARLAPKIPFPETRGALPLPVSGTLAVPFGAPDGFGGTTRGMSFQARPKALVSAPADGWVAFAGPFRSFGQMVILNTGSGYYVLLAGLQRLDVELNQFVLAGEPLGVMGESAAPGDTPLDGDRSGPVLYVEFRKDGASIDPGPWWAKTPGPRSAPERRTDGSGHSGGTKVRG